jgi:hypothetical protein
MYLPAIEERAFVLHPVGMPSSAAAAVPLVVQLLSPISESEEAALVTACSLARKESPCVSQSEAHIESTLRASVEMTGPARILIEITDSHPRRTLFVSRELTFESHDDSIERARAIGLALGVLSSTLTQHDYSPPKQKEPELDDRDSDDADLEREKKNFVRSSIETDEKHPELYLLQAGFGAEAGPSWVTASPAGAITLTRLFTPSWGVTVQGKGGIIRARESRPRLLHVDILSGPFLYRSGARGFTWVLLSGGITWMEARLPTSANADHAGSRISPLMHVGAGIGWHLSRRLSLTFSPGLDLIFSPTEVYVDSASVGSTGRLRLHALVGITWRSR